MRSDDQQLRLVRMERISRLLDSQFRIPGTGLRFGLDGLLGLLPGAGDLATGVLSAYIIHEAWKAGVRKRTLLRMGGNVIADFIIGSVPLFGDAVDFFWKANLANLHLARTDIEVQESKRP